MRHVKVQYDRPPFPPLPSPLFPQPLLGFGVARLPPLNEKSLAFGPELSWGQAAGRTPPRHATTRHAMQDTQDTQAVR